MKQKLLIYVLATALLIVALRWQGATLITPLTPNGIIDLEFAQTAERLQQIKLFWNSEDVVNNILLDFAFIIAYTGLFITALQLFPSRFTSLLRKLAIGAGLLDFVENILMMLLINERIPATAITPVYYIALAKFILVAIVILSILFQTITYFLRKRL